MNPPRKRFRPSVYRAILVKQEKICPICRKRFQRPLRKYSDSMWVERVCCSHSCAIKFRPKKDPREKFYDLISPEPNSGCWLWLGTTTYQGYGQLRIRGASVRAHRFAFELYHGSIPDGLFVLHKCDVPCCVNPDHLYLGTPADNARDAVKRNRTRRGILARSARLTEAEVREIRKIVVPVKIIAAKYDVTENTIRAIKTRQTWGWLS